MRYVYYGETDSGRLLALVWLSAAKRSESSPRTTWIPAEEGLLRPALARGVKMMKKKPIVMPKFVNEAQEADWWASREGREFVKQKAAGTREERRRAEGLGPGRSIEQDRQRPNCVAIARTRCSQGPELATRKGIGYQTLPRCWCMKGFAAKRAGLKVCYGRPPGRTS